MRDSPELRHLLRPLLAAGLLSALLTGGSVPAFAQGGGSGTCVVTPDALDFGTVVVGQTAQRSFTIKNTTGPAISGLVSEQCDDFAIVSGDGPFVLAAGDSVVVTVSFTPGSPGPKNCSITTGSDCADVAASGTGENAPMCTVNPASLVFGSVTVGQTSQKNFTLTNVGGGTLTGTVAASCPDFSIVSGGGAFALTNGQSLIVTVEFAPSSPGAKNCTITTGTSCADVPASGTGESAPSCDVSPTSLTFGTVTVGESADDTFTIQNTGGGTLTGTVAASCPDFSIVSGGGAFALTTGQSLVVTVRFSPSSSGAKNCTITTGTSCADVPASGTGESAPSCDVSPTSLTFGTVTVGESADDTFTIQNTGGGTLTGTVAASCPDFSIVSGGGAFALTTGQSLVVTVRLSPSSPGAKNCTITTGTSCADVPASGTGVAAADCNVTPSSIDFGPVNIGESRQRTFTIKNDGGGTVSGTVAASCADFAILSGGGSYSLAGGDSVVVTVEFAPSSAGAKNCTITTGSSCSDVSATGTGQVAPSCSVNPTSLDFGTVTVGESADRSFTIKNTGGGTITGSAAESCPADFTIVSGGGAFSLSGGDSVVVTLRFAPGSAGTKNCTVTTGSSCADVSATGVGQDAADCTVVPTSLDFGTVVVGDIAQRSFTITNSGGGTLTGNVAATGCPDFTLVSGGGIFILTAGQSKEVTVEFSPSAAGVENCTITTGTDCPNVIATGRGQLPAACSVLPSLLDFGTVTVGQTSSKTFTIKNTGGGSVTGDVTESCDHYAVTAGGGPFSLASNDSVVVTVQYSPFASGQHDCTIETGSAQCADVSVTGNAEDAPQCAVAPATLDFGTVTVGQNADRTFTIRNDGGGTVSGSVTEDCDDYSIVSGGGPFSLGADQTKQVTIRFSPGSPGLKSCTISTGADCADVAASGTAQSPPLCSVAPQSLDHGQVTVGESSERSFEIRNTGGGTLNGSVTISCDHFSIVSGGGVYALGANQARNVVIRYTPTAPGEHACTVETGASCANVQASGSAENAPSCTVIPTLLDYGTVPVGETKSMNFTIKNTGGGTVIATVSEACTHFEVTSGNGASVVGAGDSVVVSVAYTPAEPGEHVCSITTGPACSDVEARGTGDPLPDCTVTPTTLDFGLVDAGGSAQRSFTIKNDGGGTVVGAVVEACDDFTVVSGGGAFALAGGESVVVTVEFEPTSPGPKNCQIQTGVSCDNVNAIGTGDDPPLCDVSPTSLDFGTVFLGGSSERQFVVENDGGGRLNGRIEEFCAHYRIISGGGNFGLARGETQTVTVRFEPSAVGNHGCAIETGSSCPDVGCAGVAENAPACAVTPTTLDFGVVTVNETSQKAYQIENTGGGRLTGTITESCPHFRIAGGVGSFDLAEGQTRTVTVEFTPTAEGTHNCSITNGASCPNVSATGQGRRPADCDVSRTFIDFGTVTVGATAEETFTITNSGGSPMSGTVVASCPHYTVLNGGGDYTLPAGESRIVTVQFGPGVAGEHLCTVSTGALCDDVDLRGLGEDPPECAVSATSIDYGTVIIGEFADRSFTIENTGGGTLRGAVGESCPHYRITEGRGSFALDSGEALVVTTRFEPTTDGRHLCSVETGTDCPDVALSGDGERAPLCAVTPQSLDFGTVAVGSSSERIFTIENTGGGIVNGNIVESCDDYVIAQGGGAFTLTAGQSRDVTVRFSPTTTGTRVCTIDLGPDCPDVECTGFAEPPSACLVSATSLQYGQVRLGESADRSFTITNTGGGVLIGSVTESCDHYEIVQGDGQYVLATGQSVTVTVRFEPIDPGTHGCTIETGGTCAEVVCTGTGVAPPTCFVTPDTIDFGTVEVGGFLQRSFAIRNIGGGTLFGSVSKTCDHYEIVQGAGGYALSGGQTRTVTLRFVPTTSGTHLCTVETGPNCDDVSATGRAVNPPACQVSTSSLDFGTVPVGQSDEREFTIRNTGGGELSIDVTESCPSFEILFGGGAVTLPAGGTRTVTVQFAPTSAGNHICTIETGDACPNVTASGVAGQQAVCTITPTSLEFGTVDIGTSKELSFTIQNNGNGNLGGNVSASCPHYAVVSGGGGFDLPPGGARGVTVRYAPQVRGLHSCLIETGVASCSDIEATGFAEFPPEPTVLRVPPIARSRYLLWSLPLDPENPADSLLSDVLAPMFSASMDSSTWIGFTLDGTTIVEDPPLEVGRGVWLRTERTVPSNYEVRGDLRTSAVVALAEGWNVMAPPGDESVALGSLRIRTRDVSERAGEVLPLNEARLAGIIGGAIYDWSDPTGNGINDGTWLESSVATPGATIDPWTGRLVYAYEPCEIIYGFTVDDPPARVAGSGSGWTIGLAARSGGLTASGVSVGVTEGAFDGWDVLDLPSPPLPGSGLDLAVDHRDDLTFIGAVDRRGLYRRSLTEATGGERTFRIHTSGVDRAVEITWSGLETIPADLNAFLLLPGNVCVPMRERTSFTFATASRTIDFDIVVTTGEIGCSSETSGIRGVFPMPLSRDEEMRIQYEVVVDQTDGGLRIYDLYGRVVRDFGSIPSTRGVHEVRWNGRDRSGKLVGAGMYYVRLRLGNTTHTVNQVVVR